MQPLYFANRLYEDLDENAYIYEKSQDDGSNSALGISVLLVNSVSARLFQVFFAIRILSNGCGYRLTSPVTGFDPSHRFKKIASIGVFHYKHV
jgi:hypothetical protein